jgi:hypothetical protein
MFRTCSLQPVCLYLLAEYFLDERFAALREAYEVGLGILSVVIDLDLTFSLFIFLILYADYAHWRCAGSVPPHGPCPLRPISGIRIAGAVRPVQAGAISSCFI